MLRFTQLSVLVAFLSGSFNALASETVYLKPGQCLLIGSQQVCALQQDQTHPIEPKGPPPPIKVSQCRWGAFDDTDKKAQGWAHFLVTVQENGTKTETMIRYFGPADKEGCEKAAKDFEANLPHPRHP